MADRSADVLVTGGSGFVATYCIAALLRAGRRVRTTVRDLSRARDVRDALEALEVDAGASLTFSVADLTRDEGWNAAVEGCRHVLHVASPLPSRVPRDENELIAPAREGTLRVLRASHDARVERVVLTSSFAAIGYGHAASAEPFDERRWTNLAAPLTAYTKSKTLAERAAWEFVAREGDALELTTVNPVVVVGPVVGRHHATSIELVKRLIDGTLPAVPRLWLGIVDVRDIAELHLRAMTHPAARGERFLAVSGDFMSMREIAATLRAGLGERGRRIPARELPDWLVRLVARVSPEVRAFAPEIGKWRNATSAKARTLLGWQPRPAAEALLATAESLLRVDRA